MWLPIVPWNDTAARWFGKLPRDHLPEGRSKPTHVVRISLSSGPPGCGTAVPANPAFNSDANPCRLGSNHSCVVPIEEISADCWLSWASATSGRLASARATNSRSGGRLFLFRHLDLIQRDDLGTIEHRIAESAAGDLILQQVFLLPYGRLRNRNFLLAGRQFCLGAEFFHPRPQRRSLICAFVSSKNFWAVCSVRCRAFRSSLSVTRSQYRFSVSVTTMFSDFAI